MLAAVGLAPGREATLGRYEVLCLLATGGMASVHLARAAGIGGFEKLLVIKRILPHAAKDESFIQMFLDEARIAATLDHANVAHVFDVGSAHGDVFLAMEFLHGHDLRSVVRRVDGPLPIGPALAIAISMCAGLHYAHDKRGPDGQLLGLVHRDVSPSNVVVTYDGSVKVIDFGIAKATNRLGETVSGVLKGKPGYMSPEQCLGDREIDRRSDVFCVGIVLYELTTGTRLFGDKGSEFAQLREIVEVDVAPPSRVVAGYPPELERIVVKALRREPNDRYQTALELQRDLEAFALSARADVSPSQLASLMQAKFRDELEAWRAAEREGISLAEYLVARGSGRASRDSVTELGGAATETAPEPRHDPVPVELASTAGAQRETPTAVDKPLRKPAPTTRAPWTWIALALAAVVAAATATVVLWPASTAHVARDAAPVGAPPIDLLAAARAAEHDGKLELALARYLESYDSNPDSATLFRIGELYERLDRPTDAVLYFKRYLDRAPTAQDRDAVVARIARLEPTAGARELAGSPPPPPMPTATRPVAKPARCHCALAQSDRRWADGHWLCKQAHDPPLCFCGAGDLGLCPTPFEHCDGTGCQRSNGIAYTCADPLVGTLHVRGKPNTDCTGYLPDERNPPVQVSGKLHCNACATSPRLADWTEQQFGYSGATGDKCTGYTLAGEAASGKLECIAK